MSFQLVNVGITNLGRDQAALLSARMPRNQMIKWFELMNVWSTNLRSMIQAEVVHRSLAKILSQAKVDLSL